LLRAAGSDSKERIYFIKITARDGSGNTATKTVKVIVPQNQENFGGRNDIASNATGGLSVKANPNPSQNYFTIIAKSNNNTSVTINITDVAGRIIEKRSNVTPNSTLRFGDKYGRGIYIVQVIQENEKVTLRLIKD